MRLFLLITASTFICISACTKQLTPEEFLAESRQQLQDMQQFSFKAKAMYPSPTGKVDTSYFDLSFEISDTSPLGYDYIVGWKNAFTDQDLVYLDKDYKVISHLNKLVKFYPEDRSDEEQAYILKALPVANSPIWFLKQTDWSYAGDTLMNGQTYKNYFRIEADRMYKENKILTEQHIFISESDKLIGRYERRNYLNGTLSQLVVYTYSDFREEAGAEPLAYDYPTTYSTSLMGSTPYTKLLKAGDKAPDFSTSDEEGNLIRLADYRGKKVLLDFSIINCGYCLQSMAHFNEDDFRLSEDIKPIYINPVDNSEDMTEFDRQYQVPFPVIVNRAPAIAEQYGVYSYPVFYLIDENGVIEKVVTGYDEEFQESLEI